VSCAFGEYQTRWKTERGGVKISNFWDLHATSLGFLRFRRPVMVQGDGGMRSTSTCCPAGKGFA